MKCYILDAVDGSKMFCVSHNNASASLWLRGSDMAGALRANPSILFDISMMWLGVFLYLVIRSVMHFMQTYSPVKLSQILR